jgi:hypothetical protein
VRMHPRALLGWVGVSNLTLPSSGLLPCHQPRESSHLDIRSAIIDLLPGG